MGNGVKALKFLLVLLILNSLTSYADVEGQLTITGDHTMRYFCFPIDYKGKVPPAAKMGAWKAEFSWSLRRQSPGAIAYLNISNGACRPDQSTYYGDYSIEGSQLSLCNGDNTLRLTFQSTEERKEAYAFNSEPKLMSYQLKLIKVCITRDFKESVPYKPPLLEIKGDCSCVKQ